MRTVTVVLVISIIALLLLAACGEPELLNPPTNASETNAASEGTGEPAGDDVTETTIDPGTPTEVIPTPSEPAEAQEESQPTPTPSANQTTPTTPSTPAVTMSDCPLISAADVANACNKSDIPTVTIDGLVCRFHWGQYEVNVTNTAASTGDYNAWANTIPTAQEGRFKPASTIAEYNKMKYYGWFTGKRLITATSNNLMACTLSRLDAIIARVDVDAKIVGEVSTVDKLAGAVDDTGKKALTSVDLYTLLTAKFDKTVPFEGNYSGSIKTAWASSAYKLLVTLKSVPKATYTGYLVKKTGWHVIKLGQLEETSDGYTLAHASSVDLRDHNWFVLTTQKDGKEEILSETSTS